MTEPGNLWWTATKGNISSFHVETLRDYYLFRNSSSSLSLEDKNLFQPWKLYYYGIIYCIIFIGFNTLFPEAWTRKFSCNRESVIIFGWVFESLWEGVFVLQSNRPSMRRSVTRELKLLEMVFIRGGGGRMSKKNNEHDFLPLNIYIYIYIYLSELSSRHV